MGYIFVVQHTGCLDIASTGSGSVDTGQQFMYQPKGTTATTTTVSASSLGNGHFENWGESVIADTSQQTDTSTDVDTDDKNQVKKTLCSLLLSFCC